MSLTHRYADFGKPKEGRTASETRKEEALEDVRLSGYENGYQAGWDDATEAHRKEEARVLADLAQNLEDMSFTFHEAYAKLLLALNPVFSAISTRLLPELRDRSLQARIMEELTRLVEGRKDQLIELTVSPLAKAPIESLLKDRATLPFEIVEEEGLVDGQVFLRVGKQEAEINLDQLTQAMGEAFEAFFEAAEREAKDD